MQCWICDQSKWIGVSLCIILDLLDGVIGREKEWLIFFVCEFCELQKKRFDMFIGVKRYVYFGDN